MTNFLDLVRDSSVKPFLVVWFAENMFLIVDQLSAVLLPLLFISARPRPEMVQVSTAFGTVTRTRTTSNTAF